MRFLVNDAESCITTSLEAAATSAAQTHWIIQSL